MPVLNLTSGASNTAASNEVTASITPVPNRPVYVFVATRTGITVDPTQPTLSGCNITWVVEKSVVYDNTSSSRRRLTIFRGISPNPTTGVLTMDEASQTQTTWQWSVNQVYPADTSGVGAANSVVQSPPNSDPSGVGTTLSITLAAGKAGNTVLVAFANANGLNTLTLGAGYTNLSNNADTNNDIRMVVAWRADFSTTASVTASAGSELGGIALEVKADSSLSFNNYQQVKVGDGMSMGDKIR